MNYIYYIICYFLLGLTLIAFLNWNYSDEIIIININHSGMFIYFLYLVSLIVFFPLVLIYIFYSKLIRKKTL